ncbi:hypothetical protein B0920_07870 [Massilia sp. KIM]|uniref:hypothetical protein n=1 Tax=Massilia sp. KIM TaxID=1955422 RepID=UPI00098FC96C|nr:hypothetical protein [Massilia sp. KIM]OON63302.1 hypothetical protein B0920_07870 [Massilia sp. KIM]
MSPDNIVPFERRAPPSPPPDFDPVHALRTCRSLMQALGQYELTEVAYEACITMLMINLHDLLQAARTLGKPLVFDEHIDAGEDAANITELVARCRNAACHVWVRPATLPASAYRFRRVRGGAPATPQAGDGYPACAFEDDVALYYGRYRLYLKRHVRRAIEELAPLFAPASPA